MKSSRYRRPTTPRPVALTERDVQLFAALDQHRFLTAKHVHSLLFEGASRRRVQARLRLLWENGFVERLFLPSIIGGGGGPLAGVAIYALSQAGAARLQGGKSISHPPGATILGVRGAGNLLHSLVVSDLLIALSVACRRPETPVLSGVLGEGQLWSGYLGARQSGQVRGGAVIADGSFSLEVEGRAFAFHLEVIRADLRGGNRRFVQKLGRYAELARAGFFRTVHGQNLVRAVLIATPSQERSENLRHHAATSLRHGRSLFWFTWFDDQRGGRFHPAAILTLPWTDLDGRTQCLARPSS